MKIINYSEWTITARLMLIALLPIVLLVSSAIAYSNYTSESSARRVMDFRGNFLATTLASVGETALTNADKAYLHTAAHRLLATERSARTVAISTHDGTTLVHAGVPEMSVLGGKTYVAHIERSSNLLSETNGAGSSPHTPLGVVRVTMALDSIVAEQRSRNFLVVAITILSVVICATAGLMLAHSVSDPLNKLAATFRTIREGDYAVDVAITDGGEIGELQAAAKAMAVSLSEFRSSLESRVAFRTMSLEEARDDAVKANEEKRKLIRKSHSTIEDERKMISAAIHDHLNPLIVAVRLEMRRILDLSERSPTDVSFSKMNETARSAFENADAMYSISCQLTKKLRPEVIDTLGLPAAVLEVIEDYQSRTSCQFRFQATGDFSVLDSDLAISVFRMVQETLSNIIDHSQAAAASVVLDLDEEGRMMTLTVIDEGIGFDQAKQTQGLGIIGMRERAYAASGRMDIIPLNIGGMMINIALPLPTMQGQAC